MATAKTAYLLLAQHSEGNEAIRVYTSRRKALWTAGHMNGVLRHLERGLGGLWLVHPTGNKALPGTKYIVQNLEFSE